MSARHGGGTARTDHPAWVRGHTMLAVRLLYGTGSPVWARYVIEREGKKED
jgi:hypothetical protein